MCLVAFAVNTSGRWPLVIASNRDESFERPTLPLQRWQSPSGQTIFSGRDVLAGGTWLGTSAEGRVAFLTNVREHPLIKQVAPRSRGELVVRWLEGRGSAREFMGQLDPAEYGGFNLVVGDWRSKSWTWLGNRPPADLQSRSAGRSWISRDLPAGIYGLSNAALDTPWPKTLLLKAALTNALENAENEESASALEGQLWNALASRKEADQESMPNTGVPADLERALSSAFVYAPARLYGTRCSTLLVAGRDDLIDGQINLRIEEKTFPPADQPEPPDIAVTGYSTASQRLSWPA